MSSVGTTIFVGRLAGTSVFDPLREQVGKVRDVVVIVPPKGMPRAVGLVVEVPGRRRVFLPLTRVTSFEGGQVISTGLVNMRRFEQRALETLAVGELLEREVTMTDGSGRVIIEDLALEKQRTGDWTISQLFVRRATDGKNRSRLGLRRRGESFIVDTDQVTGLSTATTDQPANLLLAAYDDLKAADLADVLHELGDARRIEVAAALNDDRLADVLEELPDDDQVAILSALESSRAADVLEAMQPDDAADLLSELPEDQASALLDLMEPEDASDVRRLLAYESDTAGGVMTTEAVVLPPETSIATALAHIRRSDITPALASMVFVCRPPLETPTGRFLGVVHFQRLLREPPHQAIGTILDSDIEPLSVDQQVVHLARMLATYNMMALPVLDDDRRLVGVVSVDDVLDHLLPEDWREHEEDEESDRERHEEVRNG